MEIGRNCTSTSTSNQSSLGFQFSSRLLMNHGGLATSMNFFSVTALGLAEYHMSIICATGPATSRCPAPEMEGYCWFEGSNRQDHIDVRTQHIHIINRLLTIERREGLFPLEKRQRVLVSLSFWITTWVANSLAAAGTTDAAIQ
jgi:hypothetical protein